jgi:hypothetical protein
LSNIADHQSIEEILNDKKDLQGWHDIAYAIFDFLISAG